MTERDCCRHRAIRNARPIPDLDIGKLSVSNVAPISIIADHAPGQDRSLPVARATTTAVFDAQKSILQRKIMNSNVLTKGFKLANGAAPVACVD
ncbi:hypothetical protein, partial [Rhodoferax sp.]|uniref:hypothetical protein n=1 Tax=Rhodoferax sp. TaxID=50421 RepID=UPI003BB4B8F3